jgi:hypothetical protein
MYASHSNLSSAFDMISAISKWLAFYTFLTAESSFAVDYCQVYDRIR